MVKKKKKNACQCRRRGFDPWFGKGLHSSILVWKIPWTEELGGSMRSQSPTPLSD